MPASMIQLVLRMTSPPEQQGRGSLLTARADRAFDNVNERLGTSQYFAGGEFTAADIMMVFPLTTMRAFMPRDLAPYPHIRAYLHRIGARPAYQSAMQKADPGRPLTLE